jgi:hypothetical protein
LINSFQGIIKTLSVGPLEVEFVVHEDILCKSSPFFASACKEEWKQGREHYIPLKGDEPSIVDLYLQWIYTGRIFSRPSDEGGSEGEGELGILVEGYIFGEKVQNVDFKDAVLDAIVKCFPIPSKKNKVCCPPVLCVDKAYGGTPEGSQLRKLLVAIYATRGSRAWLRGTTSMEFLADLAARLLDERKWPTTGLDLTGCEFHQHGDDEPCYRIKTLGGVV